MDDRTESYFNKEKNAKINSNSKIFEDIYSRLLIHIISSSASIRVLANYFLLAIIASLLGPLPAFCSLGLLGISCFKPGEDIRHFFAAEVGTGHGLDASGAATVVGTGVGRGMIMVGSEKEFSGMVVSVLEEGTCWDLLFL